MNVNSAFVLNDKKSAAAHANYVLVHQFKKQMLVVKVQSVTFVENCKKFKWNFQLKFSGTFYGATEYWHI